MTFIETVVWIAVYTAAMIALATSVLYFYRTASYSIEQASAVASAQHGIDVMVRSIREASYASNGAYPIVSMSSNDLVFYANIRKNDPLVQRIHYYVVGTTIMQGVLEPSGDPPIYSGSEDVTIVAPYVQNIAVSTTTFTYYDSSGLKISDYAKIASVRFISVNVVVDINPNNQPVQLTLRSSTALRNLDSNN
ncbi:hypothetical protein HY968_05025 [Candidatus Kaiserbacteria bacterium]|nr:hypothetical protein [Candidatus Kaiserbacteria bacterium]